MRIPSLGNPEDNAYAISWCDVVEGSLFVYSGNMIWSFSLSSPHWQGHVISHRDVTWLSRCGSTIQSGLPDSDKSGLYLLCAEDLLGFRSVLRLKVNPKKEVELDYLGRFALFQERNDSTIGMTVAICDEIVALILAHEDNLPVWVIDNETGCLVKTGNSWVGYALKWFVAHHIHFRWFYKFLCLIFSIKIYFCCCLLCPMSSECSFRAYNKSVGGGVQ